MSAATPEQLVNGPVSRVDRGLRWGLFATVLVAVAVLAAGTLAVYQGAPPIPDRVLAADGSLLYTRDDIVAGKAIFQRTDLMDFGSLYGNGAYFGPDWTADYLHREALIVADGVANSRFGMSYAALTGTSAVQVETDVAAILKGNHYADGTLAFTTGQTAAFGQIRSAYRDLFLAG